MKKRSCGLDMVVHTCNHNTQKAEGGKVEATLVYIASSKPTRDTWRVLVFNNLFTYLFIWFFVTGVLCVALPILELTL